MTRLATILLLAALTKAQFAGDAAAGGAATKPKLPRRRRRPRCLRRRLRLSYPRRRSHPRCRHHLLRSWSLRLPRPQSPLRPRRRRPPRCLRNQWRRLRNLSRRRRRWRPLLPRPRSCPRRLWRPRSPRLPHLWRPRRRRPRPPRRRWTRSDEGRINNFLLRSVHRNPFPLLELIWITTGRLASVGKALAGNRQRCGLRSGVRNYLFLTTLLSSSRERRAKTCKHHNHSVRAQHCLGTAPV